MLKVKDGLSKDTLKGGKGDLPVQVTQGDKSMSIGGFFHLS